MDKAFMQLKKGNRSNRVFECGLFKTKQGAEWLVFPHI